MSARRAERDQFVRVHRQIAGGLAAERRLGSAVLQEVAGHPVIFAGAGQILDRFAPVAAMQLGAAFARRADQHHREARVERHRHQRGFAVARDAFDADLFRIHGLVGFQIIEAARSAPAPGAQRAPIVGLARLAFVDQTDDALGQTGAVVRLDAAGIDGGEAPAVGDQLFGRGRVGIRGAAADGAPRPGAPATRREYRRGEGDLRNGAAAEHHHHRHRSLGVGGHDQRHLNIDLDIGIGGIVHVPDELLADHRMLADLRFGRLRHFPGHLRNVLGNAAQHLAIEVLDDLRAALIPPHRRAS